MAEPDQDRDLHDKIDELNQQITLLAAILDKMAVKMGTLEQATTQLKNDIREELNELKDEIDSDKR